MSLCVPKTLITSPAISMCSERCVIVARAIFVSLFAGYLHTLIDYSTILSH